MDVGIRKVLGANKSSILYLLASQFIKTVLIGFAIAIPIAYILMNSWLQAYAYRVVIDWRIFLLTGLFITISALMMISVQTLKQQVLIPLPLYDQSKIFK